MTDRAKFSAVLSRLVNHPQNLSRDSHPAFCVCRLFVFFSDINSFAVPPLQLRVSRDTKHVTGLISTHRNTSASISLAVTTQDPSIYRNSTRSRRLTEILRFTATGCLHGNATAGNSVAGRKIIGHRTGTDPDNADIS